MDRISTVMACMHKINVFMHMHVHVQCIHPCAYMYAARDKAIGSVCLSVCLFVCKQTAAFGAIIIESFITLQELTVSYQMEQCVLVQVLRLYMNAVYVAVQQRCGVEPL